MADDEVHIHAEMGDEIARALEETKHAAEQADRTFDALGRSGAKAGAEIDKGMTKAKRSTDRARDAAGRFVSAGHAAGEAAETAGRKAAAGSVGYDKWAKSVNKASRAAGGLAATMMLIKWGTILTGGVAVVGMLVALASGAVMATGALSPMVGVVGALGPAMALLAASTALMKISGADVKALMVPLGNDFKAMRYEITQGMVPGIQRFNQLIEKGLVPTLKGGLVSLGATYGAAAGRLGEMLTQGRNVRMIGVLFNGLNPIILLLVNSLGRIVRIFISLAVAALPTATSMAEGLDRVTRKLEAWTQRMTDSGRAQAWMLHSWELMKAAGRTVRDFLIGFYNILRLAGQVGREEFGGGMSDAAASFRRWTESAGGVERILRYFRDATPAIRETLALLRVMGSALIGMAADSRVAPLINQIRTELMPAISDFIRSMTGSNGFGPAVVDVFSALFTVLSNVPFGGLTLLAKAIGGVIWGIAWLVQNVPGLGMFIGSLLTLWVVAGAGLKVAGKGISAFSWISKAIDGTGKLSLAQKAFGTVLGWISPILRAVGIALMFVGKAMWGLVANPIGITILVIVGLLLLLWWKWDWVKEAFMTGIRAIGDFFVWLGGAMAQPFIDLWNIVKAVYNFIAEKWNSIPSFTVPDWVPFIGGKTFELPKLPMLAKGGVIEYGTALVGEQGPEALVKGGRFLGMVGLTGPELRTDLPRGGYVVPSLDTLSRIPGLTRQLPGSVADAVAGALPSYGALLNRGTPDIGSPDVRVHVDTGTDDVVDAIHELTNAIMKRPAAPPGNDQVEALLRALRKPPPGSGAAARYRYSTGGRL